MTTSMEVLQLQQLLQQHSHSVAWQALQNSPPYSQPPPAPVPTGPYDLTQLHLSLLLAAAAQTTTQQQQQQQQQQNLPPPSYHSPNGSSPPGGGKPQRSASLHLLSERQPFRDLHSQVYGVKPPHTHHSVQYSTKQLSPGSSGGGAPLSSRSSSGGGGLPSSGGRWATTTDQRDVVISEQLALVKNLNETINQNKQAAVEQDALRRALEATVAELRSALSVAGSSPPSPSDSAGRTPPTPEPEGHFTAEAQVAYYKEHAEQWSCRSTVDRQQLIQVLRTLIASNKRYQQPLPPMCVKPDCRCRNCWFLHARIDETAWAAAWELHMSLR